MLYKTHKDFCPNGIKYAFFNKMIPFASKIKFPEETNDETKNIIKSIFACKKLCFVDQKHTNKVILADMQENFVIADAMVCNSPKIALAILTADCVPILFADEDKKIIGAAHSGWRGARDNIISNVIKKMKELGATKISACIGPCIKQENYEVDQIFYEDFISENKSFKKFFKIAKRKNYYLFDITAYVKEKLRLANITQIFDLELDTYSDEENYFSFRRYTHYPEK